MSLRVRSASKILVALMAIGSIQAAQAVAQPRANRSAVALADFTKRVNDYVALHDRLAGALKPIKETKDQTEIAAREKALGEAIRAARAQARPGDIFAPAAAAVFKKVVAEDLRRHPASTRKTENDPRESESADFRPTINQTYPSTEPLETFPAELLFQLPTLPKQVEYRIVGKNLILRDTEANVVIDFIPVAIP